MVSTTSSSVAALVVPSWTARQVTRVEENHTTLSHSWPLIVSDSTPAREEPAESGDFIPQIARHQLVGPALAFRHLEMPLPEAMYNRLLASEPKSGSTTILLITKSVSAAARVSTVTLSSVVALLRGVH